MTADLPISTLTSEYHSIGRLAGHNCALFLSSARTSQFLEGISRLMDQPGSPGQYTIWTLIFAVLNFRGFHGSTAIRESLVQRKFRPAFTGQQITSILINSDVIILQNGYHGLGRSEHRCGVASNRLCEQTHEILLGT